MNVLMRLTLRNLKLNRKRTIVTIIGIILSGAMLCGVAALIASFQDLFIESAKVTDGNYHATLYEVPVKDMGVILNNANTETGMLTRNEGFSKLENADEYMKPYILVKAYDEIALKNMPVRLTEGRFPVKENEIVVSEQLSSQKTLGLKIGQEITLPLGNRRNNGEILDQNDEFLETEEFEPLRTQTYIITGMVERPRFESFGTPAYIAITYLDKNSLTAEDTVNISILLEKPKKIYAAVPKMAEAAGVSDYSYNRELLRWMGITNNGNYYRMLLSIGSIIISLIIIGSVTVIYNAFAISVNERKKQFGMLSSVGATMKQIKKTVYFEGLIIGLIGIPIGILSGILGIGATISIINPILQESMIDTGVSLRLVVSPMVIIFTVVFSAFIIMLSAYLPAQKASRVFPIEAIRLTADYRIKGKKLRTSKLTRWIFGFEGELALKNLKRNRKRYRTTVFSLFISIVLFVSFSAFMMYGFESSEIYYRDIPYDISVYKFADDSDDAREFFDQVAAMEGIKEYVVPRTLHVNGIEKDFDKSGFKNYINQYYQNRNEITEYYVNFSIITLNREAFDNYIKKIGLDPSEFESSEKVEAVLINKDLVTFEKYITYEPADVSKGDVLRLYENQYDETKAPAWFDLEIAAVTDQFPFGLTYNNSINLIVSEADFESIRSFMSEENRQDGDYSQIMINSDDPDALEQSIRELHSQKFAGTISVHNALAMQRDMNRTKLIISIFLYGFITLITLIGVTNIFNTINTNIALRRREIAMLKSVGLTPEGFSKMMRYESIFYGLKALLYGLPVSILVSFLMHRSFGSAFDFGFRLPWNSILYCIIGVFLITFITMVHAGRKLKNDNIADTLKAENL
ncbi:MAG TPA: FtsX-like permease family protein [Clostridiales bacterium]|nr:FtsX-like permease family protein [Clostridiales bacterium]